MSGVVFNIGSLWVRNFCVLTCEALCTALVRACWCSGNDFFCFWTT